MGYNIGPKIGIEGETQFRQQIKSINNEYKTLQAQTKALTAEFDKNDDQQGKLKMQTQQLEKQIDAQKRAIEEMENALKRAETTQDANADAVTVWEGKLWDAKATVSQLEKELADTEDALRKMEDGIEDTGDAADEAGEDVSGFGDILKGNLAADVIWDALKEGAQLLKEIGKDAVDAAAGIRAEESQFEQTFGDMEQAAKSAMQNIEKRTGISATRIKGNFSTVYAFAKTMGADSEEALDIASRAMSAAADSAAYYDKTVEEATETIQAYIKGNYANDAALGIASTEFTRNAAALERYGKAFKDLTENQKVDTLLAMVEAGNKASGAMGQAAREAAEWTNVTGELEDAQRQLMAVIGEPVLEAAIPVVQELTEALREMAEVTPGEDLRRSVESFLDTIKDSEEVYRNTAAEIKGTYSVGMKYLEQLKDMESAALESQAAHDQYLATVSMLQKTFPELGITINESTGLIDQNIEALIADANAWKNLAIQQALYAKMESQVKAYGEAVLAAATAEEKRDDLLREKEISLETLSNLLGIVGAAEVKVSRMHTGFAGTRDVFRVYDEAGKLLKEFGNSALFGKDQTVKLAEAAIKADKNLNELDTEVEDAKNVISEYEAEMQRITSQIEEYTNKTDQNAEALKQQEAAISQTQAALLEYETACQEAENSTRAMLDSSIGLWSEMAEESDWTAERVLKNWRSQMAAFNDYSANLKKAEDMGLSEGIIEALSDGSQQSMQILDAMVNQSQYSVGEINAAFTDLDLAKDGTTDVLMDLNKSLQEGYDKLVEDAKAAGLEIVDGIVQAIQDNAHKVGDALADGIQFGEEYQSDAEDLSDAMIDVPDFVKEIIGRPKIPTTTTNYFEITQLPGENAEEFARRVAELIQDDYEQKAGGLGG